MTYSVGDGDKLKIRLSQIRDAGLIIADELLKLTTEALQSGENEAASMILDCARKIKDAIQELREKMETMP